MNQRRQWLALIVTALLLAVSLFRPLYPFEQFLQHGPTVVALLLLACGVRRQWLSEYSLYCLLGFLLLHILGARYIYSYVPYDDWTKGIFGSPLSGWFGWKRNHYDRLVHLGFGVLVTFPLLEWGIRWVKLPRRQAAFLAVTGILALSALYEILEWLLTLVASPEEADSYNGQQGDIWDAQKDMALACLGSLLTLPWLPRSRESRAASEKASTETK